MKKLIFSLAILFASICAVNAQSLNSSYDGSATDLYMGRHIPGSYSCTTSFNTNNAMTGIYVAFHTISFTEYPSFSYENGVWSWNGDGNGTITTVLGKTYSFIVDLITMGYNGDGKLEYYFQATADNVGSIHFTFTAD